MWFGFFGGGGGVCGLNGRSDLRKQEVFCGSLRSQWHDAYKARDSWNFSCIDSSPLGQESSS